MTTLYDWQDRVGGVWAAEWRRTDRSFADLAPLLDAAILAVAPDTGCAVDIGTGAGATAAALAGARPGLSVVGIDLSSALLAVAAAERGPLSNLRYATGDVSTAVAALAPVDLFVSRHGVMFFDDPVASFTALRTSASPGAAMVFSCFAARTDNAWTGVLDAVLGPQPQPTAYVPGPFAFADPPLVEQIFRRSGWTDATRDQVRYRYVAGEGATDDAALADAVSFFSRIGPAAPRLAAAGPRERASLAEKLRAALSPYCRDGAVVLGASAWLWSARAGEAS